MVEAAAGSSTPSSGGGGTTPPETPTVSINGASASASGVGITVNEGASDVASISTSVGSLSIVSDSTDAASFNLSNGELTFSVAPDFESPGDANTDNVYEITVRATNSTVSTNVPITVTVTNLFEGAGRVIDGPVTGASVFVDANCNSELDEDEVSATTDEAGFYLLPGTALPDGSECSAAILSIGGIDTATQVERTKLVLKTSINDLDSEQAVLTPLSSLLAEFDTEEEKLALLEALGLQDVSIEDLLESDPWADASQSEDAAKKSLGQAVQRLNAQIITITDTVLALVSDADASTEETVVAAAAISQAIGENLIANSNADANTLADNAVLSSAISSAFVAAEVALQEKAAENAGETFDQTVAKIEAEAKAELLSPIISQATSATSLANSLLADESVDPTSTLAAATAKSAQTLVVSEISSLVTEIRQFEAGGSSTAELAGQIAESVSSLADSLSPSAIAERIEAEGGDLGDLDTDGDGILNPLDNDDDGDGIPDAVDDFTLDPAASKDTDGDGAPDDWNEGKGASDSTSQPALMLDNDDDDDSIADSADNCPLVQNADQINSDSDDDGDACDADDDNDSIVDDVDNCPLVANSDQANSDQDLSGDACDSDDDDDGVADSLDNCPLVSNADQD